MGSLGNLARAASISSLLTIAFVAALTCRGAIRMFCPTSITCHCLCPLSCPVEKEMLVDVRRFATNWERVRG